MNRQFLIFMTLIITIAILLGGSTPGWSAPVTGPGMTPDYYETPNWAYSPPLRKFVDTLPGLTVAGMNNLGQYITVANPDTTTYPGSDYYEIGLRETTEVMHSDMPGGTVLREYYQINNGTVGPTDHTIHYLGPIIIAQKDRPVRVKFVNELGIGSAGNLFIPVDTTVMGSGEFEIDYDPATKLPIALTAGMFTQNRATLHLHGGHSPWISDGTPNQWITPAGETTAYPKGVSVAYVPDMWFDSTTGATITACAGSTSCGVPNATNNPGPGSQTYYWSNQQSSRMMFYHDHAWGITRLNVYIGEAAGYLITDQTEQELIDSGLIPAEQIPLVLQDKTFVDPATIIDTDPTWAWGRLPWTGVPGDPMTPFLGDLWWPHVYVPAQNPYNPDLSGINPVGRWHYGPWFWPPTPVCGTVPNIVKPFCVEFGPVANPYYDPACVPDPTYVVNNNFCQPPEIPGTPDISWGAEAFLDTPVVNGTAYPTVTVLPKAYRFRILNAAHDRFFNLQLYRASSIISSITLANGGSGYSDDPAVIITGGGGTGATAAATIDPSTGAVIAVDMLTVGSGYTSLPTVTIAPPETNGGTTATASAILYSLPTEVGMVPAAATAGFPAGWPADGREGGVPDPATRGPKWIQIGTEGGFLPQPVVLPNRPVAWNLDPTMFNVGNVLNQADGGGTLFLGPAERADVIIDFSAYAGQTLILYNDAPTAFPALDPHYDFYTSNPDRRDMGGTTSTPAGYGPNVRTIMQIQVAAAPVSPTYDLAALQSAFVPPPPAVGVFEKSQAPIIVGQSDYNSVYDMIFPSNWPNWGISRISDTSISFWQPDGTIVSNFPMKAKALHDEMGETFDEFGRMSAKLGLEVPFANAALANFVLQSYVDPASEIVSSNGEVQIWKITHNGVDTHPIHFHLFEVQLLNRVGWDGFIRRPDPNELGWKDTVRIAPLEDTIVALRAKTPTIPFPLPDSIRPLNPARPAFTGDMMGFSQIDQQTGNALAIPTVNEMTNFGWEFVWHCHILSHEENDMMRPIVVLVSPEAPSSLAATGIGPTSLTWLDNSASETEFALQRDTDFTFPAPAEFILSPSSPNTAFGVVIPYSDAGTGAGPNYFYRVRSSSLNGNSAWSNIATPSSIPFAYLSATSLSFDPQLVSTTSDTQTVTLYNTGTVDMTGIVISLSGTNPGDFDQTNNCTIVTPGASCSINVTFTPSAVGDRSASLDVSSDAINSPVAVALSGTGISPVASVLPTALIFGNQPLNRTAPAQAVTLTNNGTAILAGIGVALGGTDPGDFGLTNNCASILLPGLSCTLNVTFTPATEGVKTATITITSSDPADPSIPVLLSGTGITQPEASVTPASLSFGNQLVSIPSATQLVTLSNSGSADLLISSITIGGTNPGDFNVLSTTCGASLAVPISPATSTSCTINVAFTPVDMGMRTATMTIISDDPINPALSVTLDGFGIRAVASVFPASLDYGSQMLNTTSGPQSITLSNSGNITMVGITNTIIGTNAADFKITATTCNASLVAPTAPATSTSCTVTITFTPKAGAVRSASLSITTSDPLNPTLSIALSGIGIAPVAEISPTSLNFGSVLMGTTTAPQVVTLSNTGTAPLTISGITVPAGDFAISDNTCGAILAESLSCAISITFSPTFMGAEATILTINSNDPTNPTLSVPLNGIGIQAVAEASPASVSFGNQLVLMPGTAQLVTLANTGNMTMAISGITLSGTNVADFSISSNTCGANLTAGASCLISIKFTPAASGLSTASLDIASNASNAPTIVPLNGTGTVVLVSPSLLISADQLVNGKKSKDQRTVTMFNSGAVPLTINSVSVTGADAADFLLKSKCKSILKAGSSCSIQVIFNPLSEGIKTAEISISDADPTSPQIVQLRGTGRFGPAVDLSPASPAFGNVPLNTISAPQAITLTNTGDMSLIIKGIKSGGSKDFVMTNNCPIGGVGLAPAASCTINVTFAPIKAGVQTGSVTIGDNATGSKKQTILFSGTGI